MPRIAVTMGDPAGIGPEICAAAMTDPGIRSRADYALVGSRVALARCAEAVGFPLPDVPLIEVEAPGVEALEPGVVSAVAGTIAHRSILEACRRARVGEFDALVTAPVSKESLRAARCQEIGHTEILARELGVADPLTLFVTGPLRVFFLTRHLSLRQALDRVTRDRVLTTLRAVHGAMSDLGFTSPRIAVAALNPHASDGGQFGTEEAEHLEPAVQAARAEGIDAYGPVPADSVFHQGLEGAWDCVLSLYHDQGHIATKTRDFYGTVTATLGLPVLRTSVDHGVAFDIAWQGKANATSMVRAIDAALELLGAR